MRGVEPAASIIRNSVRNSRRSLAARARSSCLLQALPSDNSTSTTRRSSTTTSRPARFRTGSSGSYPSGKGLSFAFLIRLDIHVTLWSCCGWPLTSVCASSASLSSPSSTPSIEWCQPPAGKSCVRPPCAGSTGIAPSRCSDPVSKY